MTIKSQSRGGIQRISESEQTRPTSEPKQTSKQGKTCVGCRKYFNYLRAEDKLCTTCNRRHEELNKK